MTRLLVSVRDADEAEIALAGGADLVDVKEPSRGSLGRADDTVIAEVLRRVSERRPVSAALGELRDWRGELPPAGLTYVKWGLAGCGGSERWRTDLTEIAQQLSGCSPVAVVYADWREAEAPESWEIIDFVIQSPIRVLLVDTWKKEGATLLDWMNYDSIDNLCRQCRSSNVTVALAGSLGTEEIQTLLPSRPDWIAVRGAACAEGERTGGIMRERVRVLKDLLARESGPFHEESQRFPR
jgi:(5-formylfuran-3-yl)methyl phosphate synthase